MQTFTFRVKDMSCNHCKSAVESALKQTGVAASDVNLELGTVEVTYDGSQLDINELRSVIEKAGYDVEA